MIQNVQRERERERDSLEHSTSDSTEYCGRVPWLPMRPIEQRGGEDIKWGHVLGPALSVRLTEGEMRKIGKKKKKKKKINERRRGPINNYLMDRLKKDNKNETEPNRQKIEWDRKNSINYANGVWLVDNDHNQRIGRKKIDFINKKANEQKKSSSF